VIDIRRDSIHTSARDGQFRPSPRIGIPISYQLSVSVSDHGIVGAERIIAAAGTVFGLEPAHWGERPKEHWMKGLVAGLIRDSSLAPNAWVAERLAMGATGAVSRTIHKARERTQGKRKVRSQLRDIERMSISSD
jgi:hypothetical protein